MPAEVRTEFTPWRGRIGGDVIVAESAAYLCRILPNTGFAERGIADEIDLGEQISDALSQIGRKTKKFGRRRPSDPSTTYRNVKILSVRVPTPTVPPVSQHRGLAARQTPWLSGIPRTVPVTAITVQLRQQSLFAGKNMLSGLRQGATALATRTITEASIIKDRQQMLAATAVASCSTPTEADWQVLFGWYNTGQAPNPPIVYHHDHLHVFSHAGFKHLQREMARGSVDALDDCDDWPDDLPDHQVFAFASVTSVTGDDERDGFDAASIELSALDRRVGWVEAAFDEGAVACSSSFYLEPGAVVSKGLEDNRARIDAEMRAREAKGLFTQAEHEQQLKQVQDARDLYATGAKSAAIDLSSLVAMPVEHPWSEGYDFGDLSQAIGATFAPIETPFMVHRAFAEMQLGSNTHIAPQPGEVDVQWIGYSKFSACETGRESKGIYLGASYGDRQPMWADIDAGFDSEESSFWIVAGDPGSGKLLALATIIPCVPSERFPDGLATMGDLIVGDRVFDSAGNPCTVTSISPIVDDQQMHHVTIDDGQTITACEEHQWLVSDRSDRLTHRKGHRRAAVENWERRQEFIANLEQFASTVPHDEMSVVEFYDSLTDALPTTREWWATSDAMLGALRFVGCPFTERQLVCDASFKVGSFTNSSAVKLWPTLETLDALQTQWRSVLAAGGTNVKRWGDQIRAKVAASADMATSSLPERMNGTEIARQLSMRCGFEVAVAPLSKMLTKTGIEPVKTRSEFTVDVAGRERPMSRTHLVVDPVVAVKSLALRVAQTAGARPNDTEPGSQVVTTGDMIHRGLKTDSGQSQFAVAVAGPLNTPEVSLPVDPYVFGMWLGDGSSADEVITSSNADSCTDTSGLGDLDHLGDQLNRAGFRTRTRFNDRNVAAVKVIGLKPALRELGVLGCKHIPTVYFHASVDQRLAVLQGVVDSDGHVDPNGSVEVCLSDERLAGDVLRLIRGLGIKASVTTGDAGYRTSNGTYVACKTRHRIKFTTTLPVARLPRKAMLLPTEVRPTQQWHYIVSITPTANTASKCITVDSPDSTYLCAGNIPTHNTTLLASALAQAAFEERDSLVGNFKPRDTTYRKLGEQIASRGWPVKYYSLDDLTGSDGPFDPFKVREVKDPDRVNDDEAPDSETTTKDAASRARNWIMKVHPWGNLDQTPLGADRLLLKWLQDGASRGARCVGEALSWHLDDPPENVGDPSAASIINPILGLARDDSMFRMFVGLNPEAPGWSTGKGMTIIERGNSAIDFPSEGSQYRDWNLSERCTAVFMSAFVNSATFGLAYRRAIFAIDEVWVVNNVEPAAIPAAGRLWRSFRICTMLTDQRITGLAHLRAYANRVSVGFNKDPEQAKVALAMVGTEATNDAAARMRNFKFQADPDGGVRRGALWLHRDARDQLTLMEQIPNPLWMVTSATVESDFARIRDGSVT